jgi:hypothetical protein
MKPSTPSTISSKKPNKKQRIENTNILASTINFREYPNNTTR